MGEQVVQVVISGRVQGVWYRAWTREEARGLGLRGWVRNRADGTVEALFAGEEAVVAEMLARCQEGPERARVTAVSHVTVDSDVPAGFEVRRS